MQSIPFTFRILCHRLYTVMCTLSIVLVPGTEVKLQYKAGLKKEKEKVRGSREVYSQLPFKLMKYNCCFGGFLFKLSYVLGNEPKTQSHQTLAQDDGVKLNSRSASCKVSPSNSIPPKKTLTSSHLPRQ